MSDVSEPYHLTAGYLGQPGQRSFFLQWEDDSGLYSVQCEKVQVDGLADLLARVLADLDDEPATDWDRRAMELREPVLPAWRLGAIGVGADVDADRVVVELNQLQTEEEDEPEVVRLVLDRDIARRLAAHGKEVVGEGRPTCELCGRPMSPDGAHVCPRTNGYGRLSR